MKSLKGSALITALFIMALIAIAATAMSLRMQIDIRRTELTVNSDKLYRTAEAVNRYAANLLAQKDAHLSEENRIFPKTSLNGFQIKGEIYDRTGKFDLNQLTQKLDTNKNRYSVHQAFIRLLLQVSPDLSAIAARNLMRDISSGAPYSDISQIRPIVPAKIYRRLAPFITTFNKPVPININSVSAEVLYALSPDNGKEKSQAFIAIRKQHGAFKRWIDLNTNPQVRALNIRFTGPIRFDLKSEHYLSRAFVSNGDQQIVLYDALEKVKGKVLLAREWRG